MSTSTPALRCKDSPARLELGDEALVTRAAAVLQSAGYTIIPIVKRIGPFEILAVNAFGLVLTCVVAGEHWPETHIGFGPPPGWPVNLIRQIMRWPAGAALPVTMVLAR